LYQVLLLLLLLLLLLSLALTVKRQSYNNPCTALDRPGAQGRWDAKISRQSAHEDGKSVSFTHRPPLSTNLC